MYIIILAYLLLRIHINLSMLNIITYNSQVFTRFPKNHLKNSCLLKQKKSFYPNI